MLSVSLLVNSMLSVVKFWGAQKSYGNFLLCRVLVPQPLCCSKVNCTEKSVKPKPGSYKRPIKLINLYPNCSKKKKRQKMINFRNERQISQQITQTLRTIRKLYVRNMPINSTRWRGPVPWKTQTSKNHSRKKQKIWITYICYRN